MSTSPEDDSVVVIMTTTFDDESAAQLARTLVEERLAACVTRMAARSVYRWESAGSAASGEICDEAEVLLLIKSARSCATRVATRILQLHTYECPEIVVLFPDQVEEKYRTWLLGACR